MNELQHGLVKYGDVAAQPQALNRVKMPKAWNDSAYRRGVVEAEAHIGIGWQIRINREERGLTQSELAERTGTKQSAISRLEDPQGHDIRVSTLLKVAHAFDCALIVRLVPYSDFAALTHDVRPDRLLVCGFGDDADHTNQDFLTAGAGNGLGLGFGL